MPRSRSTAIQAERLAPRPFIAHPHPTGGGFVGAGFDDPQCAFRRPCIEYAEEFSYAIEEGGMGGPRTDFEHQYAGAGRWRITKHLAKIAIQCYKRSVFAPAHFTECLVGRPAQPLTDDCEGIVAGGADQISRAPAEILVELKFHAAFSVGTGMTRSRAASAPYAIAARTSSWVGPGYSASSSASVMSSARKSRISETQIRVPLMQGFPPQIRGSMLIRSRRGFTLVASHGFAGGSHATQRINLAHLHGSESPRLRLRSARGSVFAEIAVG
jgi:hypothetical protein